MIFNHIRSLTAEYDTRNFLLDASSGCAAYFDDFLSAFCCRGGKVLNQLISITRQMRVDLITISNHKYIAHQTSLLYVTDSNERAEA